VLDCCSCSLRPVRIIRIPKKTVVDVFQQKRRNTVDILMVVDDSCSMIEEQQNIAANFASFIQAFDGVDVDWQIGVVTTDMVSATRSGRLAGGDDELILLDPAGRTLDRLGWDKTWAIPSGVAWQLDPAHTEATGNDSASVWCPATATYGAGDKGSPGAANVACGGGSGEDTGDTGSPTDPVEPGPLRAPTVGDLVFTEFLPDPAAVDDGLGEWVEITNISPDPLDLSGHALSDTGRNMATFPAGTEVPAGGRLVVARSPDAAVNGGIEGAVVVEGLFTLNNNVQVLTRSTPGADEIFSEMVAVGTSGAGIETGLAAAAAAFDPALLASDNAGFLREDANLSLIFVSDENDYSGAPVDDYYRFFGEVKGEEAFRDHGILNFSAVVGKDVPPFDGQPSCESPNGVAAYGSRYVDLASRTEGALENICDEDFAPIAAELGLTVSGLDLEFVLSEPCDETTLTVRLFETEDSEGPSTLLEQGVDYSYVVSRNSIRFEPDQVPPSEIYIVAEYEVLTGTATSSDTGP